MGVELNFEVSSLSLLPFPPNRHQQNQHSLPSASATRGDELLPLHLSIDTLAMRSSHLLRSLSLPPHHQPSLSSFSSLLSSSQPARLTGLISHWPALDNWTVKNNLGRLRERASGILVPVEWARKGRGFMDEGEKGKTTMLLGQLLARSSQLQEHRA